jgi:Ca2+-dependent lipid-binding protein
VHKTAVKNSAGKKPVWNETFDIPVTHLDLKLTVHVWEEDKLSNDDLGVFKITPRAFTKPGQPEAFDCYIKDKKTATLYMSAKWVPGQA